MLPHKPVLEAATEGPVSERKFRKLRRTIRQPTLSPGGDRGFVGRAADGGPVCSSWHPNILRRVSLLAKCLPSTVPPGRLTESAQLLRAVGAVASGRARFGRRGIVCTVWRAHARGAHHVPPAATSGVAACSAAGGRRAVRGLQLCMAAAHGCSCCRFSRLRPMPATSFQAPRHSV